MILLTILIIAASIAVYYGTRKKFVPLPIDDSKPLFITESEYDVTYYHWDGRHVIPKRYNKKTFLQEEQIPPSIKMTCQVYSFNLLTSDDYNRLFKKTRIRRLWEERYKQ